jgi:hypothetical protein
VTDEALALAFRTGMPYVGLRDHAHDPELDHLIPPDAARTARVIPLTADDDRIRLAVADPQPDLSALGPYLSGRQVHLALAPREELDNILGPPPVRVAGPVAGEAAEQGTEDEHEPAAADEPESLTAQVEPGAPVVAAEADSPPAPDAGPVGDDEEPAGEAEHAGGHAEPALASVADAPLAAEAEIADAPSAAEAEVGAEAPLAEELAAARETEGAAPLAAEEEAVTDAPLAAGADAGAPLAAEVEPAAAGHPAAEEPAGAVAAAAAPPPADDHPELAGEVPSWLEPRRRRWPVVLALIIVFLVLIAAAAVVYAYVVT